MWFFCEISSYVSVSSSLVQQWIQIMSVPQISTTSYLAVTCSVFAFRVQDSGLFWVVTSGNVPVVSASWFNTGYMSTSVYGGFWYILTYFLRQGGPRIPDLCNAWFDSGYMLCVSLRDFVADVPVVLVVQVLMGAVVEETVELRRLHSLRNLSSGAAHHRVDEPMG